MANESVACVRASLQAPAGRMPLLVDGNPQHGDLPSDGYQFYQYLTSPGHDALSFTLSAEFGNPDIFVSSNGRLPTPHGYTWSAREAGSDTISIAGHDPLACTLCPYLIGVFAVHGPARYNLMAQTSQTLRTLQAAVPLSGQEVAAGSYVYYRFFVDRPSSGLTFTITTTTGQAELYASFIAERPGREAGHHQYASSCEDPTSPDCSPSLSHGAALHIAPNDPGYATRVPCLLYLAVRGTSAATFSLVAEIDDGERRAITLADGDVQHAALPHAGSYSRFAFYADASVESFTVDVLATRGDPDLFVNTRVGEAFPTREAHDLVASTDSHETLRVTPGVDGACRGCTYRLTVYAYEPHTEFFVSVTTRLGTRLLSDGLPTTGTASAGCSGSLEYFRYFVRDWRPVDVVLTPLGGNPSLFAQFGCRPSVNGSASSACAAPDDRGGVTGTGADSELSPASGSALACNLTSVNGGRPLRLWTSSQDDGVEVITLQPSSPDFCQPPCTLYIGVRSETPTSAYSVRGSPGPRSPRMPPPLSPPLPHTPPPHPPRGLPVASGMPRTSPPYRDVRTWRAQVLVSQRANGVAALVDGQPQQGLVSAGEVRYYTISLNMTSGLTATLTSFAGSPSFAFTDGPRTFLPSAAALNDPHGLPSGVVIYSSGSPLRLPPAPGVEATYTFAVFGGTAPANFSFLASSGHGRSLLVDNVPQAGLVYHGQAALYVVRVPATAVSPQLYVTSLQGTLRLLMSVGEAEPTEAAHAAGATATPARAARLALTRGAVHTISVSYPAGASARSFASFNLLAFVAADASALLLDGLPQVSAPRCDLHPPRCDLMSPVAPSMSPR